MIYYSMHVKVTLKGREIGEHKAVQTILLEQGPDLESSDMVAVSSYRMQYELFHGFISSRCINFAAAMD